MFNGECMAIKDIKPGLKNINVIFIVLDIGAATVTKENREVRNFKVGDHSACINVSIWDEPGKLIIPGDIIKLTKGYASIWRHCLTLYSGKNGEVYKIGEFCMTFNEAVNMSEPKRPEQQQQPGMPAIQNPQQLITNVANSGVGAAGGVATGASQQLSAAAPVGGVQQQQRIVAPQLSGAGVIPVTTAAAAIAPVGAVVVSATPQSGAKQNRGRTNTTRSSNLKNERR